MFRCVCECTIQTKHSLEMPRHAIVIARCRLPTFFFMDFIINSTFYKQTKPTNNNNLRGILVTWCCICFRKKSEQKRQTWYGYRERKFKNAYIQVKELNGLRKTMASHKKECVRYKCENAN